MTSYFCFQEQNCVCVCKYSLCLKGILQNVKNMKFFAISKDYLFVWKKKFTQRVKQSRTYTRRSSIGWFTSQVSAAAGAGPIPSQEQELPLGLPCWCKVPRPAVSFCCFHRLLARTWMGSGAAETGAHPMNCVGCLYCRQ